MNFRFCFEETVQGALCGRSHGVESCKGCASGVTLSDFVERPTYCEYSGAPGVLSVSNDEFAVTQRDGGQTDVAQYDAQHDARDVHGLQRNFVRQSALWHIFSGLTGTPKQTVLAAGMEACFSHIGCVLQWSVQCFTVIRLNVGV